MQNSCRTPNLFKPKKAHLKFQTRNTENTWKQKHWTTLNPNGLIKLEHPRILYCIDLYQIVLTNIENQEDLSQKYGLICCSPFEFQHVILKSHLKLHSVSKNICHVSRVPAIQRVFARSSRSLHWTTAEATHPICGRIFVYVCGLPVPGYTCKASFPKKSSNIFKQQFHPTIQKTCHTTWSQWVDFVQIVHGI